MSNRQAQMFETVAAIGRRRPSPPNQEFTRRTLMTTLTNEAPRLRSTQLGERVVRIIDCAKQVGAYPEETRGGWRLLCRHCHAEIIVTENDVIAAEHDECA
jgi:hypothetical protein